MSYNTTMDTITVNDVEYDVERVEHSISQTLTIQLDDEPVFEGLEGHIGYEEYDTSFANPREWSNVGTMAVHYRGYSLGDEDPGDLDFEIECPDCNGSGESENWIAGIHDTAEALVVGSQKDCQAWLDAQPDVASGHYYIEWISCVKCDGEGVIQVDPATYFRKERGARVVMPLFVYEHSGITIQAGAPIKAMTREDIRSTGRFVGDDAGWDTSFVGFVFDTPEGVQQCMGDNATDEQIEKCLDGEVEVYASYLEGDVTYWSVQDEETGFTEGCGGYVGDHKNCEYECFAALESAIERRLAEYTERDEMAARDIETV